MPVPEIIRQLVQRFEYNKNAYRDPAYLEAQTDRLVYELYGLSEEEIKIVEGE